MRKLFLLLCVSIVLGVSLWAWADVDEIIGISTFDEILGASTADEFLGQTVAADAADGWIGSTDATTVAQYFRANGIHHDKYVTTTAGTVSYGHMRVSDGNGEPVCISLFDSSGNNLLSCSGTLSDDTDGWENISCSGTYEIVAATTYYIGYQITDAGGSVWVYRNSDLGEETAWKDSQAGAACGSDLDTAEETAQGQKGFITLVFDNQSGDPS